MIVTKEILTGFLSDTKDIVLKLHQLLAEAEAGPAHARHLETYGQMTDGIVGAARTLAMNVRGGSEVIQQLGDYAAVCKIVAYRAAKIKDHADFYAVCIALLMDATDTLEELLNYALENHQLDVKQVIDSTFIDRLKWVAGKFSTDATASPNAKKKEKLNQDDIDSLIAKLGLG